MAPEDAAARGIESGDIVKLYNERGIVLTGACVSQRIAPGSVVVAKGSRVDPIAPHIDRGGAINLISPEATVSKNCKGFSVTGYLVEAEKLSQEEYDGWKRDYPEAFERAYDAAKATTSCPGAFGPASAPCAREASGTGGADRTRGTSTCCPLSFSGAGDG